MQRNNIVPKLNAKKNIHILSFSTSLHLSSLPQHGITKKSLTSNIQLHAADPIIACSTAFEILKIEEKTESIPKPKVALLLLRRQKTAKHTSGFQNKLFVPVHVKTKYHPTFAKQPKKCLLQMAVLNTATNLRLDKQDFPKPQKNSLWHF